MAELVKTYYESGELQSECFEILGQKHGAYKRYYRDGQLWWFCPYIDNKKHGECETYGPGGTV